MNTYKCDNMRQSSPGNITMRPGIHSRCQRDNKSVKLGFAVTNNEILNSMIEKWPSPLKEQFYSDWNYDVISIDFLDEIQEILLNYFDMNYLSDYFQDIREILSVIDNMIIPERNSSSEIKYTPEHASIPKCAEFKDDPRVIEKLTIPKSNNTHLCSNKFFLIFISLVIVIISVCVWSQERNQQRDIEENKIEEWKKNIIEMRKKFPSQNEGMWFSIQAGVKETVTGKPVQPSVFLLLYKDRKTSSCLAHTIGKEATKLFNEFPLEPIIIKGEDLKRNKSLNQDYGLFTETYKHAIEEKHVMIILDLQEIPAALAQSFHILCDVENPVVGDAAFLFTLHVDSNEKQNPTAVAEKHLQSLWKDSLDIDIMDSLITRVTNQVLSVQLETDLPC